MHQTPNRVVIFPNLQNLSAVSHVKLAAPYAGLPKGLGVQTQKQKGLGVQSQRQKGVGVQSQRQKGPGAQSQGHSREADPQNPLVLLVLAQGHLREADPQNPVVLLALATELELRRGQTMVQRCLRALLRSGGCSPCAPSLFYRVCGPHSVP